MPFDTMLRWMLARSAASCEKMFVSIFLEQFLTVLNLKYLCRIQLSQNVRYSCRFLRGYSGPKIDKKTYSRNQN